ncbi:ParB/RepB/Spo0J family partition protein [Xylella taiwanensis]|uniref:ParB/RepB/Spo0J family partition protein n=1 Tax=Xylella taiwanensis TaxID=1444770 RepID=Z9JGT0_9GAMM|nr:ParB/RepB/Spo0J family partition protein [Xylella taiwanensis]AXI82516.1 plasmid partitioning protein ParB [Xylella taiwanensis]EWS77389.1 plasmid partitioning protein ParB [Xylella taiwanensis]MCD8455506.1 ParB/RepB/Spo0J family partition protein [Xylella taiwanensis]MCD8457913.1 ParB/RepB/Spo0J family partition protein [Xylella taiwanensis]MCD8460048.1 ParB/RepB/Spo0J family partition protein [Xylella taiwanensis]
MSLFGNKIKPPQIQNQIVTVALSGERIEDIDPDLIDLEKQMRSKDNPGFTIESLMELGNDMKRDGQHEPVVLRKNPKKPGRYLMVAGERRWLACKAVGIKLKAVVRELTDDQVRRVQRAENIQRENLTQLEIAVALRDDKKRLGTLEKVAAEWNKGINWVAERINFLEMVEANSLTSQAVAEGITADITVINDLYRLEKISETAAKTIIDQAKVDPGINMRKTVREKLQDAKPATNEKSMTTVTTDSRMQEFTTDSLEGNTDQQHMFNQEKPASVTPVSLPPEAAQLVALAAKQMETLCTEVSTLSKILHQRQDVISVLGDVLQSVVQAQAALFRTRHVLASLANLK